MCAQQTFSLCSVHTPDKLRIFLRLGLFSLSTLDSGVSDRGVCVSVSAAVSAAGSSLSGGEDAMDESISWSAADSCAL